MWWLLSVKLSHRRLLELRGERSWAVLSHLDSLTCHLCRPGTPLSSLSLYVAFLARPVVSRTVSQSWSSFLFGPSLFIAPRVCGRSIDLGWDCGKCFAWLLVTHALTACVRAGTMGPSLYQGQKINNSGSGQRQGGDVKCAALNVFTHGMLTGAE